MVGERHYAYVAVFGNLTDNTVRATSFDQKLPMMQRLGKPFPQNLGWSHSSHTLQVYEGYIYRHSSVLLSAPPNQLDAN